MVAISISLNSEDNTLLERIARELGITKYALVKAVVKKLVIGKYLEGGIEEVKRIVLD